MKKTTALTIILISAAGLIGCSKLTVEKKPVVIMKETTNIDDILTEEDNEAKMTGETSDPATDSVTGPEQSENSKTDADEKAVDADTATSTEPVSGDGKHSISEEPAKLTIEIEGMKEEINAKTLHSSLGYRITYDSDRFDYSGTDEEIDSFIAKNSDPGVYPYIYLNISLLDVSKTDQPNPPEKAYDPTKTSITGIDGGIADYVDTVKINDYEAYHYKYKAGDEWNSIIRNYYVIEAEEHQYMIETQYFLEAAEGFGARMAVMLDTFTLE